MPYAPDSDAALLALAAASAAAKKSAVMALPTQAAPAQVRAPGRQRLLTGSIGSFDQLTASIARRAKLLLAGVTTPERGCRGSRSVGGDTRGY